RQKVEEQRPVVVRLHRQEPPAHLRRRPRVQLLQVGRLPGQTRPVVDDLDRDFALGVVELHESEARVGDSPRFIRDAEARLKGPLATTAGGVAGTRLIGIRAWARWPREASEAMEALERCG